MGPVDMLPRCRVTHKIMHPDERSARKHLATLRRRGVGTPDDRMYECVHCRALHVGHSKASFATRIRKATAVGSAKNRTAADRRKRR